jgi:uncharacterized protein YbcI
MSLEVSTRAAATDGKRSTPSHHPHVPNGPALAAISRRIVALLKEYTGKGPVKTRTYYWGDLLVVMLSDGYTAMEHTLLREGLDRAVIDQRAQFHEVTTPHLKRVVEEELDREVIACLNSTPYNPDFNAKVFVLAPHPDALVASDGSAEESSSDGDGTGRR